MATPTAVQKVHDYGTFLELVGSGLTVIDFSANWCGPCKKISPVYELFATEYTKLIPELKFIKVDVDEVPHAAQGVSGLPTFQFWVDNQKIDSLTVMGASVDKLRSGINDFLTGNYVLEQKQPKAKVAKVVQSVAVEGQEDNQAASVAEPELRKSSSSGLKLKKSQQIQQEEPITLNQEF